MWWQSKCESQETTTGEDGSWDKERCLQLDYDNDDDDESDSVDVDNDDNDDDDVIMTRFAVRSPS